MLFVSLAVLSTASGFVASTGNASYTGISDTQNSDAEAVDIDRHHLFVGATALILSLLLIYFAGYSQAGKPVREKVNLNRTRRI